MADYKIELKITVDNKIAVLPDSLEVCKGAAGVSIEFYSSPSNADKPVIIEFEDASSKAAFDPPRYKAIALMHGGASETLTLRSKLGLMRRSGGCFSAESAGQDEYQYAVNFRTFPEQEGGNHSDIHVEC